MKEKRESLRMPKELNREGVKTLLSPFRWVTIISIIYFISACRLDVVYM